MNTGKGTFIAFATAPGSTASDNAAGRNGLFTSTLIETLKQPGLTLDQIFNRVREKVFAASGDRQLPWVSSSVIGKFYFRPPAPGSDQAAAPVPPQPAGEITAAARQAAANMYGDGRRLFDARRFADAAPMLERATLIDPSYADAFRDLGIVRGHLGQYQASVQSLTEAIRLKPDSYESHLNRGIAYGELGQYQPAVDDLTRAIALKPDAWAPYWQRGVARGRLGDRTGSEADLAKARQLRGR
jgi:tetratricopeptide (TPR) repeat protein